MPGVAERAGAVVEARFPNVEVVGTHSPPLGFESKVAENARILEQLQVPLAAARARLGLPGTSPDAARNFRDKARMKEVLRAHGIPCARHALATTDGEALANAATIGYPLVAKPPAGAGAKSTVRVENPEQLRAHLASCPPSAAEPLLLEEFVQGREFSFDSVSIAGRHVFHSVSTYTPTPLEVVQNPWIQWNVLLPRELDSPDFREIFSAGPRALDALGMHTGDAGHRIGQRRKAEQQRACRQPQKAEVQNPDDRLAEGQPPLPA